jgi:hypothetical protein
MTDTEMKRTTTKWKSISDHQELATELVRMAFNDLFHGVPDSDEGKYHLAAEMIGHYMATIACWERSGCFHETIEGQTRAALSLPMEGELGVSILSSK